ncbi:porin [Aquincola sp. MAHUQ-54]|uniref:Porin n=1 Tax=Aquincola agrisoli TaxID=3119538 RepID=A0AAW9Q9X5_9BURK
MRAPSFRPAGARPRPAAAALAACLAAAAVAAHAQGAGAAGGLRIHGELDAGFGTFKPPGGERVGRVESGLWSPSYLAFSGAEPLGGSLRAVFSLETYVALDNGVAYSAFYPDDPFWGRAAYVGLEGRLGALTLGRNRNPFYYAATAGNAFGESYFSPALTVGAFRRGHVIGRAHDNSVRYTSPTWGGAHFSVLWAPKEEKSNGNDVAATAEYAGGPWHATLGLAQAKTGLDEGRSSRIGLAALSHDFGVAKLFVAYATQRDTQVRAKSRAWDLGATVPLGRTTLKVSVARIRQTDLDGGSAASERVVSLGADHRLAPDCWLYAAVKSDRIDGLSRGTSVATGMRWLF